MKRRLAAVLLTTAVSALAAAALPRDVRAFIEKRALCDHFRNEPWDGGAEARQRRELIARQASTFCTGSDRSLAGLRLKYRKNPGVIDRLRGYEDKIEP